MKLELYYKPSCPFCGKVIAFIQENHISDIDLKDIAAHEPFQKELQRIGGKLQVPCLVIDGRPLYESGDILQWLKKRRD